MPVPGTVVGVPDGAEDVLVAREVVVVVRTDVDDEAEVLLDEVVEGVPGTHWK